LEKNITLFKSNRILEKAKKLFQKHQEHNLCIRTIYGIFIQIIYFHPLNQPVSSNSDGRNADKKTILESEIFALTAEVQTKLFVAY